MTASTPRNRLARPLGLRRPEGRQAVGVRADLGADGLLRQGAVREGRRRAQPPVPPAEGRVLARAVGAGQARARRGRRRADEEVIVAGAAFRYRPGTVHRVTAIEDTTILEVSTPQLDDVVRLEDRYGREGRSPRLKVNLDTVVLRLRRWRRSPIGDAAARTGWSARMLRYLETVGLVVPARTAAGYRLYGPRELNQLRLPARAAAGALRGSSSTSSPSRPVCGASPRFARPSTTWLRWQRLRVPTGSTGSSESTSGSDA